MEWWFLFDKQRGQYVSSIVSLRKESGGGYCLYYADTPCGCRWVTQKGAQGRIDKLVRAGALPEEHSMAVVQTEAATR